MPNEEYKVAIKLINELEVGATLTNNDIAETFRCSNQGGMRKSNKTKSLVLISDHSASLYDDRIDELGIIHFTGMGKSGNQGLDRQNSTLYHSRELDIRVFYFERYIPGSDYKFLGEVKLIDAPYIEKQYDDKGMLRDVYVFPLELSDTKSLLPVSEYELDEALNNKLKKASRLSNRDLVKRIDKYEALPSEYDRKTTVSKYYPRSPFIIEYAHRRANGHCELCSKEAPFTKNKKPFLEVHHVIWLSKGGSDTTDNVVALCPNCHRKMHILNRKSDVEKLKLKANIKLCEA